MSCLFTDIDTWTVSGDMSSYSQDSALACAVNTVPEIIMTGGCEPSNQDNNGDCIDETATRYTSDGETFADLPPMPVALGSTCVVALDGDELFVTGGTYANTNDYFDKSYLYHSDTKEWEELPGLPTPRRNHMCGRVHNSNGEEEVIVAGGFRACEDDDCQSHNGRFVDIYNLQSGQWREDLSLIAHLHKSTFNMVHHLQESVFLKN